MAHPQPPLEPFDIDEVGAPKNGAPQRAQTRVYLQLQVFTDCPDPQALVPPLRGCGADVVLYLDVQDARGVGVLFIVQDPSFFASGMRDVLTKPPFAALTPQPAMTMMGRTYSSGREADLLDWLTKKPSRVALDPQWPWAIWYPMRRKASFERLPREEQGPIMYEHAHIGMRFGNADLVRDIRLACHGIDRHDNDFVLGLIGKDLFPLSRIVQEMRKTQQTALHMESLGPFFVGKTLWQSPAG